MEILSIEILEEKIRTFADIINAPEYLLPTFGHNEGTARPEIRVSSNGYEYVIIERGTIIEDIEFIEFDDLIYRTFKDITFTISVKHELKNRIKGQDFRRVLFKIQEELIGNIRESFRALLEEEHRMILENHPYSDSMK